MDLALGQQRIQLSIGLGTVDELPKGHHLGWCQRLQLAPSLLRIAGCHACKGERMTRGKSRVTRSRVDQAQAEAVSAINHKKTQGVLANYLRPAHEHGCGLTRGIIGEDSLFGSYNKTTTNELSLVA